MTKSEAGKRNYGDKQENWIQVQYIEEDMDL